jgi:hypothetical protein
MSSAIVYLLRSTKSDVTDIIKSLNSLYCCFLVNYNYPVIILIEKNFTEEYKNLITNSINFPITFELINFRSYDELKKYNNNIEKVLITHKGTQKWPIGYRNMCRFWSGDFLNNTSINKFKYIWRMDSDAYISNKINYDLFDNMNKKDIAYCYSNICHDEEEVCKGLFEFSKDYFIQKINSFNWNKYKMFTTHVEIINTEIFKNSLYYDFYNKIDETNCFYINRWGDAPLRYIALTNLNLKCEILNISYYHGNDGSGRNEQLLNDV